MIEFFLWTNERDEFGVEMGTKDELRKWFNDNEGKVHIGTLVSDAIIHGPTTAKYAWLIVEKTDWDVINKRLPGMESVNSLAMIIFSDSIDDEILEEIKHNSEYQKYVHHAIECWSHEEDQFESVSEYFSAELNEQLQGITDKVPDDELLEMKYAYIMAHQNEVNFGAFFYEDSEQSGCIKLLPKDICDKLRNCLNLLGQVAT